MKVKIQSVCIWTAIKLLIIKNIQTVADERIARRFHRIYTRTW